MQGCCHHAMAFVEESLRYTPLMTINVPHFAQRDTAINGHFLPRGTQVVLARPHLCLKVF